MAARSLREELRVPPGSTVDLAGSDPRATPRAPGGKSRTKAALAGQGEHLAPLQEKLFAEGTRRILVVLQGMDTSGKGGVIEHVIGQVNPQGVHIASFKKPTEQELAHDFLWRIRKQVPAPGLIGIFDRSHYEDVLVVRVHELIPAHEIDGRYAAINDFEAELAADGVTILKCFLHISADEQRDRLLARLDDPAKHWKFNEGDLAERDRWADYQEAYRFALERCSTEAAPWYVIPSDRKWYRNWAIGMLLRETLTELDPHYPQPDLDVEGLKKRLRSG